MPKPKLTVKQAKFVKAKAEGKTGVQAAMEAYDVKDEATARSIASENLTKPNIQDALEVAFQKQGLTLDKLVEPIAKGLEATKTANEKGMVYPSDQPDHSVRISAAKTALELMGVKNREGTTVNINFNQHMSDQRGKYEI